MEKASLARMPSQGTDTTSPARAVATIAAALGLIVAVAVVISNAVSTSSARVSASTSSESFLTAGTVTLGRSDDSASLLFDADDLYPGREVRGCVVLEYAGSVPAVVRLHGDRGAGTGLDSYVELRLVALAGDDCPSDDQLVEDPSARSLFNGSLTSLWSDHASYRTGLPVATSMVPGDRLVIEAVAVVVDDNRAAGLTTEFTFTFEARPT